MKAALQAALAIVVAYASVGLHAQSGRVANPADPSAPAPAAKHQSAFDGYRRFEEPRIAPWRAANDEVGALRGHIDHTKEIGAASEGSSAAHMGGARPAQAPAHHHSK